MATTQPTSGPISVKNQSKEKPKILGDKSSTTVKPGRTLPTDRLTVAKQLDILRAYAAVSNSGTKPAPVNEVATVVKMAVTTVSLANAFLASIGLISRSDAGSYTPSAEVINFLRAYEWDKETASYKLAPLLKETWFGKALIPRLSFGPIEEDAAIALLAETAPAGPEYRKELRMLLDFMVSGGIVRRDGNMLRLITRDNITTETGSIPATSKAEPATEATPVRSNSSATVQTAFQQSHLGAISFNVNVQIDMSEFATWRPERIQAFFGGMAQVLSAKADVEKGGQTS